MVNGLMALLVNLNALMTGRYILSLLVYITYSVVCLLSKLIDCHNVDAHDQSPISKLNWPLK